MTLPLPKLDISKPPHPHFIDLLVPILPGGVLCIGMLLYRPRIGALLNQQSQLNYASKVALFVFMAYICGAVLSIVTMAILGTVTILLGATGGSILARRDAKANSRSRMWRIAALQFLGPGFVQELQPADEAEELKKRLEAIVKEETTIELFPKLMTETARFIGQLEADARWEELYRALAALFFKQPDVTYGLSVINAVQSVGIALIILACVADVPGVGLFWAAGLVVVFATSFLFTLYGFNLGQQGLPGEIQLASILRALKHSTLNESNSTRFKSS
jgi:hypothetical protein